MRRALLVALAGLALTAAPAAAQTPIAGGGSFNDAPALDARALYGHAAGRRAAVLCGRAQAGADAQRGRHCEGPHGVELLHHARRSTTPYARRTPSTVSRPRPTARGTRSASLRVEGQRVGEDDGGTTDDLYAEPVSLLRLAQRQDGGQQPLGAEQFDTAIDLQVTGEIIPEATPTATAESAETAEPEEETAGLGGGDADDEERRSARDGDRPRPRARRHRRVRRQAAAGGLGGVGAGLPGPRPTGWRRPRGSPRARRRARRGRARSRTRSRPGRGRTACPGAGH